MFPRELMIGTEMTSVKKTTTNISLCTERENDQKSLLAERAEMRWIISKELESHFLFEMLISFGFNFVVGNLIKIEMTPFLLPKLEFLSFLFSVYHVLHEKCRKQDNGVK